MKTPAVKIPLCVSLKTAAELIERNAEVIRRTLVATGEITSSRSSSNAGKGSRIYVMRDELEAYAAGGIDGLREFRIKHRRVTKSRKTKN
jgi:hypothetical protein